MCCVLMISYSVIRLLITMQFLHLPSDVVLPESYQMTSPLPPPLFFVWDLARGPCINTSQQMEVFHILNI